MKPIKAKLFSNMAGVLEALRRAARNLVPPPDMKPAEWAEANIKISIGNAIPGPINFDNAPLQREPLNMIKHPGCRRISLMFGAQTGKTTILQCIIAFFIGHEPRSQIIVQPSEGDMQTFMETKLKPSFDANPVLQACMARARGREGVNNSRIISYIGGWLMMSWAGSPKTLRGRSAPVTIADEVDGMDATAEGDPLQLLVQRSATFGDQRLQVESSTPTIKGHSRIETGFIEGDQRRFYIVCPHCEHHQTLKWPQVQWDGKDTPDAEQFPDTARYACEACGVLLDDGERIAAVRDAESLGAGWKASKPFKGHASFHANEIYSTFARLRDIVQSYLDKVAAGDAQSFINLSLAETYEETGEKADPEGLMARREEYRAQVPMGALYITAGIDMQMDRLEAEVVAWGIGEESWSLGYHVLWGDPLFGDVWDDLDDLLTETYQHESGAVLPIAAACLDTGGTSKQGASYTQRAYEYLKGKTGRRLFGTKGVGGWGRPIVEKGLKKQSGRRPGRAVDLFLVGADEAKLIVMRRLAQMVPGPGYCHFPEDRDRAYFDGLTSEKLVTRYEKGFPKREWHKPDKARNEPLDCRSLAMVAVKIMQPSFKRLAERLTVETDAAPVEPKPPAAKKTPKPAPKAQESTAEWSKKVAETAVRLQDALVAVREAGKKAPEIPPEEAAPPANDNAKVRKTKRLSPSRRGGWATNW